MLALLSGALVFILLLSAKMAVQAKGSLQHYLQIVGVNTDKGMSAPYLRTTVPDRAGHKLNCRGVSQCSNKDPAHKAWGVGREGAWGVGREGARHVGGEAGPRFWLIALGGNSLLRGF
jgi:hypothetical protein